MSQPAPPPPRPIVRRGEAIRITAMTAVLGALVFVFLFHDPGSGGKRIPDIPIERARIVVPELDGELLGTVRDGTRVERLQTEEKVLHHLLEQSLNVVPEVAEAMGMPSEPAPIAALRDKPAEWRGKYLWYEGTVEVLAPEGRSGHPVRGYRIHEAVLRTSSGDVIVATFSLPPDPGLKVGAWARCEGFFMKLRDGHFPPLDEAPLLVGPALQPAIAQQEPVSALDPEMLAQIRDGRLGPDGIIVDREQSTAMLVDSQGTPLWHMASYAQQREATAAPEELARAPVFLTKEQFYDSQLGRIAKGTPFRLLGTFELAATVPARMNPYGFRHWSEVWIQSRDLGGRTIAVWVPEDIALSGQWWRGTPVQVHGLFFKRLLYLNTLGQETFAPVFVAGRIRRFELATDMLGFAGAVAIGATFVLLVLFLFWNQRRESRSRRDHEQQMIERRRRRRLATAAAGSAS